MGILKFLRQHVWAGLPARATPRQRLVAAAAWGGALILLGAWRLWRIRHGGQGGSLSVPAALIAAGALLGVLLPLPGIGERLHRAILGFFAVIGFVISHVLLTLSFYLLVTPLGWLLRLTGKDLLDARGKPVWVDHTGRSERKRYYRLS